MTDSYNQNSINQQNGTEALVVTPDAAAVEFQLGALTEDGQRLVVELFGAGSDPADPAANNYTVTGVMQFIRIAGVVTPLNDNITVKSSGVAIAISPSVDGDSAILSVSAALAAQYDHQFSISRMQY